MQSIKVLSFLKVQAVINTFLKQKANKKLNKKKSMSLYKSLH